MREAKGAMAAMAAREAKGLGKWSAWELAKYIQAQDQDRWWVLAEQVAKMERTSTGARSLEQDETW